MRAVTAVVALPLVAAVLLAASGPISLGAPMAEGSIDSAAATQATVPRNAPASACRAANPPCGYIAPLMDIDLPDKPLCALGKPAFQDEDRDGCLALPAVGESVVLEGTVEWGWRMSDDGAYPNDPAQDIVLSFPSAAGNRAWMDVSVEPPEFTISTQTLADPQYVVTDTSDPANVVVWYRFQKPITVTITRTAEVPSEDADLLAQQSQPPAGILPVYVKGRSNASGTYFTGAFAVDIVQFDTFAAMEGQEPAVDPTPSNDAPAPAVVLVLAALAIAAVVRRRTR